MRSLRAASSSIAGPLALLAIAFLVRAPTFGLSEIDWDESTFALVGREILHHHWPFTTVFDDKSIGLYLHFSLALAVFGDNPVAVRLLGLFVVAAAALAVYWIALFQLGLSRRWGVLLGACYLLCTAGLGGLAVYSELFVNLYVLLAAALLPVQTRPSIFLSGFAAGLAISCNNLAAIVVGGLLAGFLVGMFRSDRDRAVRCLRRSPYFLAGMVLAIGILLLPIFVFSSPAAYFGPQLAFFSDYVSHRSTASLFVEFARRAAAFFPLAALVSALLYLLWRDRAFAPGDDRSWMYGGMTAAAGVAALATGYLDDHYFLMIVAPALLLVGSVAARAGRDLRIMSGAVLLGTALTISEQGWEFEALWPRELILHARSGEPIADPPRRVAEIVRRAVGEGNTIYSFCAPMVLYQLLRSDPPTRFPYYPDVFSPQYGSALGLNVDEEIRSILTKAPAAVIVGDFGKCYATPRDSWKKMLIALKAAGYSTAGRYDSYSVFVPRERLAARWART